MSWEHPTAPAQSHLAAAGHATPGEPDARALDDLLAGTAARNTTTDALRFHLGMGLTGFIGGLTLIVPAVLWLTTQDVLDPRSDLPTPRSGDRAGFDTAFRTATTLPPRIAAPVRTEHDVMIRPAAVSPVEPAVDDPPVDVKDRLDMARGLILAGHIPAARQELRHAELAESGEAHFMLAETYDPNVLAALSATGVVAETSMARRHYQAALARGIAAAALRLEALE